MVSNKEIKQGIQDKHGEKNSEGYLICSECRGWYQLQEGESFEDFESCECGGKLKHSKKTRSIEENFIVCPNCATKQNESAVFCKKCGKSLKNSFSNKVPINIYCPECGTANLKYADFCQNCGNMLNTKKKDVKHKTMGWWNKQSKGGKLAMGMVGSCCLGIIIILVMVGIIMPTVGQKTYQGNGVSFNYPDDMQISNGDGENGEILSGVNAKVTMSIKKTNTPVDDRVEEIVIVSSYHSVLSDSDTNEASTSFATVAGTDATVVSDSFNTKHYIFEKNGSTYEISFMVFDPFFSEGTINTIINSFQVK